jgi:hypothetical protein
MSRDLIVAAQDDELAGAAEQLRASGAAVTADQVDLATETELADELEIVVFTSSVAATIPGAFQAVCLRAWCSSRSSEYTDLDVLLLASTSSSPPPAGGITRGGR